MKFQFQLIAYTQRYNTLMGNLLKTHWPAQSEKQLSHYAFNDNDQMSHNLFDSQLGTLYTIDSSVLGFTDKY